MAVSIDIFIRGQRKFVERRKKLLWGECSRQHIEQIRRGSLADASNSKGCVVGIGFLLQQLRLTSVSLILFERGVPAGDLNLSK